MTKEEYVIDQESKNVKDGKPKPLMIFVKEENKYLKSLLKVATLYLLPKQPILEVKKQKDISRLRQLLEQIPEGVIFDSMKVRSRSQLKRHENALMKC